MITLTFAPENFTKIATTQNVYLLLDIYSENYEALSWDWKNNEITMICKCKEVINAQLNFFLFAEVS